MKSSSPEGSALIRCADVLIAAAALIFFAPTMIVVAILVKLSDGGPVLFGHKRIGRDGVNFKCLKFRSMRVDAAEQLRLLLERDPFARAEWARDQKLTNDPRVTRVGVFIRRWSLDELPQLFNVLIGEMSIVGPRPIVEAEAPRYGRYLAHYMSMTPGITGLWQASGRSTLSYRQRVACDLFMARNLSFSLYCRIILLTIPAVLLRTGSY